MLEHGKVPAFTSSTFTLSLKGAIDGLEFVRLYAGYNPEGWHYSGLAMTGLLTRQFKLTTTGEWGGLDDIREKLAKEGAIPDGQWLLAFLKAYPKNDGKGPIGIPDPSWIGPAGHILFPALYRNAKLWRADFNWAKRYRVHRRDNWRWLIEV